MSDSAILTGVSNALVASFPYDWDTGNCKGMPSNMPEPMMGDRFCSVFITGYTGTSTDDHVIEEVWSFAVCVTKRLEAVPFDRINSSVYLGVLRQIEPLIERVKVRLANRWDIIQSINALMATQLTETQYLSDHIDSMVFKTPPRLINRTPQVRFLDEEALHGTHGIPKRDGRDGHIAVQMTVSFGNMIKMITPLPESC